MTKGQFNTHFYDWFQRVLPQIAFCGTVAPQYFKSLSRHGRLLMQCAGEGEGVT